MALEICGVHKGGQEGLPGWPQMDITPLHIAGCYGEDEVIRELMKHNFGSKHVQVYTDNNSKELWDGPSFCHCF